MNDAEPPREIPIVAGLSAVADRYDGYILDLWGVLHDGLESYPGAVDTLRRLIDRGKRIAILSNGPRRAASVAARCAELGIVPSLYHHLHSSGEETWQRLRRRDDPWYAGVGRRARLIVPPRDRELLDGLDLAPVEDLDAATFILVTGTERPDEQVADYEALLAAGVARDLPMVCANPDLEVIRGGVREICAGALAARYEALGGRVRHEGKPHANVYRPGLAALGIADRSRLLAVGDSLRTDIAGARGVGIDSAFVSGGIHAEDLAGVDGRHPEPARLRAACRRAGQWPTWAMPLFAW